MQINITQAFGLLAFAPAALASAAAYGASGSSRRGGRGTWACLAAIHLLLTIEILVGFRHRLNLKMGALLRGAGLYLDRRPAQVVVIVIVLVIAALLARRIVGRAPTRALRTASASTAAVLLLFAVETISLHAVDGLLYRQAGPVLLIAWLWLACGWTTVVAATRSRK